MWMISSAHIFDRSRELSAVLQSDSYSKLAHEWKQEQAYGGDNGQGPDQKCDRLSCRLPTAESVLQ